MLSICLAAQAPNELTDCPEGYHWDENANLCLACERNMYSAGPSGKGARCLPCDPGKRCCETIGASRVQHVQTASLDHTALKIDSLNLNVHAHVLPTCLAWDCWGARSVPTLATNRSMLSRLITPLACPCV